MTCLVSIIKDDIVYIGADSLISYEDGENTVVQKGSKIVRNGDFLIAICGNPRMAQILNPCLWKLECDNILEFASLLRDQVRYTGATINQEQFAEGMDATLLVGYKKKVYTIYSNFAVIEPDLYYYSIGSGSGYALGALFNMDPSITPRIKIEIALDTSAFFCPIVGGRYDIEELTP